MKRRTIIVDISQFAGVVTFAVLLPYLIGYGTFDNTPPPQNLENVIFGCSIAILIGNYFFRRLVAFPGARASSHIMPVFTTAYGAILTVFFFFRFDYSTKLFLASFVLCLAWYYAGHILAARKRSRRLAIIPTPVARKLVALPGVEWTILYDQPQKLDCDGLVADFRANLSQGWERFIAEQAIGGVPVYHVKQIEESITGMVDIEHLSENNFGSLIPGRAYIQIKYAIELAVALIAGIALLPALAIVSLAIKLDSGGPILFRQARIGYGGKVFTVFKFRSMVVHSAADADARERAMTRDEDERVTRVGRILRRSRIDELPQLLNILLGDMSLIGPRPEALVLSSWYEREIPFYRYRHIVRPGISGWAQVNQGHVTGVNDVHAKLKYDFYYIKYFSPWLDILIVLRTIRTILTGFGVR
jgi:lipopolysaccharide/colanic/teichoic acid biosynthesis glycosyltransferase